MKRTGPTNQSLKAVIEELKKVSIEKGISLWPRIASDLEMPSRNRRIVNLSKLNFCTKENEVVVVPGKVLGAGSLDHKITISAFQFSDSAVEKLSKNGSRIIPLKQLISEDPKGKRIRIIG